MIKLPLSFGHWIGPATIALLSALCFMLPDSQFRLLTFDRYAIDGLETWRLLSANLLHTNLNHLLLNTGGLLMLWLLHGEHYSPLRFMKVFWWCALATGAGLYLLSPSMLWYVGLSGALHGVFCWGACMDIRHQMKSGWLLLAGVTVKIAYEQIYGASPAVATMIDAKVAVDAHLYGAVAGVLLFVAIRLTSSSSAPSATGT